VSNVVSVRFPKELMELMVKEAELKGVSLSMLLREIVERHYGGILLPLEEGAC
jgi:predicted DNA-binding protein